MPPAKYIAQHYFKALEQSVNKCSISRLAHEEGNGSTASVEETKTDTSKKRKLETTSRPDASPQQNNSSQHSGIAAMLAGQGFHTKVIAADPTEYVSIFELLTTDKDSFRCRLQATLLNCESEPRNVMANETSPKRRRASDTANLAVDCILLDLTGPIKLTCWGSIATDLCNIWMDIQQQHNSTKPKKISLSSTN